MRTNKTLRIASVLLIAVLMTTCIIGGTFAKYTSTTNATAVASVATWSVTADITDVDAVADGIQFNLADTVLDTNGGATETHVKTGKIAPGTKGSFNLALTNASEVAAQAVITLDVSALPAQISFKNGDTPVVPVDNKVTITVDLDYAGGTGASSSTTTINWEWAYEVMAGDPATPTARDEADMNLQGTSFNIPVSIVFTQVD